MNILEKHKEKTKSSNVTYHRFLLKYRNDDKKIYIFGESEDDISYYSRPLRFFYPQYELVRFYPGGKDGVLDLYRCFDWNVHPKNKLLFFVDRDLSYWRGEAQILASNIYITDGYSFENDLVSEDNFIMYLEEIFGFAHASYEEMNALREQYREKWKAFVENSYYIMAAVKISGDLGKKLAKNINAEKIIRINQPTIWRQDFNDVPINEYIKSTLELTNSFDETIKSQIEIFKNDMEHYFVRGKWALIFWVKLLNEVSQKRVELAPTTEAQGNESVRVLVEINNRNASSVLGDKIRPTASLLQFLKNNIEGDGKNE